MDNIDLVLTNEERIMLNLKSLYSKYGYSQFKMSKFEEYDLYAKNRDFLLSNNILTFTDTNGKLKALKPDVTLSIVRNSKDANKYVQKVYYNENVYRASKKSVGFKEIMQVGIECIGNVGIYEIAESVILAIKSLKYISEDSILDISHLEIVSNIFSEIGLEGDALNNILNCLQSKNIHEMKEVCKKNNVSDENIKKLETLFSTYGKAKDILPKLKEMNLNENAVSELETIVSLIDKAGLLDMVNIDFSIVSDLKYYNGIIFKGFVKGIPEMVLSGGEYDKLLKKMGKDCSAIGFAVYMDPLERIGEVENEYDVDIILVYDEKTSLNKVYDKVNELTSKGLIVMAQKEMPGKIRYRELIKMESDA